MADGPGGLMSNPEKMQKYMNDPDVGPIFQKLVAKLGGGAGAGMGGGGMAAGSGGQLMCGVIEGSSFQCSERLLPKPIAQLWIRSGQKVCEGDVRSYGSIQTRWTGNSELRSWFKGLTPQERVDWYVKQQQNDTGKKRSRDDMNFIDTYSNKALLRESELDECIPWRVYRRRAISDGEEATQAAYNFISCSRTTVWTAGSTGANVMCQSTRACASRRARRSRRATP